MISIKQIKTHYFRSKGGNRVLSNIASLSILQGLNYVLPLITFPYQVRVLGLDRFGLLAFTIATVNYFQIIVDYGFNLSAPRNISIHRQNKDKLSEIVSSIMIIKTILLLFAFFLYCILINSFPRFKEESLLYYVAFGLVIGQYLFPYWFFQGIEQMKFITSLNIISRTFFTLLVFVFVRTENDYIWIPALNAFGTIITGIGSWIIIIWKFNIRISLQSIDNIKSYFLDSFFLFVSRIFINIYTISTIFILGAFTDNASVGVYATADKIVQIIKAFYNPVSQSLYPFISKKAHESKENTITFLRKITKYVAFITSLISLILLISSRFIIIAVAGVDYVHSVTLLRIMSFLPFIISLSNIAGVQTMLTFNKKKAFTLILMSGGVLSVVLSLILVPIFKYYGTAFTVLIVESTITISMLLYLRKEAINII